MPEAISKVLLQQRVRNRIADVLEIASSFEDIARFGAFEVINMWEDWVDDPRSDFFAEPVFSPLEQAAIRRFHTVWDDCAERTDDDIFQSETLSSQECWQDFKNAAWSAFRLIEQRGRFSEDKEEF